MRVRGLFDGDRLTADEALQMTIESLQHYGADHRHWAIAWSGGKDSTALLTLVVYLITAGKVPAPRTLTVMYADTRMELPPLAYAAQRTIDKLRSLGIAVQVVLPEMDKRFFVYMLGRGVPPPNNNTFRWCTRQIKIEPMQAALPAILGPLGEKVLMLTGVRQGESAVRDARIQMSCGRDGAECGQGWYQTSLQGELCDTLAPILHWRVCHVWDWLRIMAPSKKYGEWDTALLADAYGGDEAEEINARTGCNGCPLANKDTALDAVLLHPQWDHLGPLKKLRPIYRELRLPHNRLRKPGGETRKDGTLVANQYRMGPLTMKARLWALDEILGIQRQINYEASVLGRPGMDTINEQEERRIRELIDANTWPQKWTGNEPTADEPYEERLADGTIQVTLFDDACMEACA